MGKGYHRSAVRCRCSRSHWGSVSKTVFTAKGTPSHSLKPICLVQDHGRGKEQRYLSIPVDGRMVETDIVRMLQYGSGRYCGGRLP